MKVDGCAHSRLHERPSTADVIDTIDEVQWSANTARGVVQVRFASIIIACKHCGSTHLAQLVETKAL
jgi:hypothetical protein